MATYSILFHSRIESYTICFQEDFSIWRRTSIVTEKDICLWVLQTVLLLMYLRVCLSSLWCWCPSHPQMLRFAFLTEVDKMIIHTRPHLLNLSGIWIVCHDFICNVKGFTQSRLCSPLPCFVTLDLANLRKYLRVELHLILTWCFKLTFYCWLVFLATIPIKCDWTLYLFRVLFFNIQLLLPVLGVDVFQVCGNIRVKKDAHTHTHR